MDSMSHPPQFLNIFFLYSGSRNALANTSTPPEASGAGGDLTTGATSAASKATQAKGKENAAAKKKNQLRKDSGLGMSYHGLNESSTTISKHLLSILRIPQCIGQYEHSS